MKKIMITASAFLFSAALTTGALAAGEYGGDMQQQQGAESQMQMDQYGTQQTSGIMSSEKIIGKNVQDQQGEKLGKIDALLVDVNSGKVGYAVVSDHPVPWNALQSDVQQETFTLNMSSDKFKEAPTGKSIANRDEEQRINEFYGVAPYWEGGAEQQPQMQQQTPSEMEPGPEGSSSGPM